MFSFILKLSDGQEFKKCEIETKPIGILKLKNPRLGLLGKAWTKFLVKISFISNKSIDNGCPVLDKIIY